MKMNKKRIGYSKEPTLHVHRYIVTVGRNAKDGYVTKYHYVQTKKEARALASSLPKGRVIEIFSAVHNFVEGWF